MLTKIKKRFQPSQQKIGRFCGINHIMVKRKQEKEEKEDDSNYQHMDAVNNKETHEVEEVERK